MSALAISLDAELSRSEDMLATRRESKVKREKRTRVGAWWLEHELGRGGMATVYAVTHKRFGKRAALKLAHPDAIGPTFTADTFLREARVANLVDHPGVADVFATGSHGGRPYLVMERLAGQTLGERLATVPMSRAEEYGLLAELADVLGAAHDTGVTHRDLKLDNVFVLDTPGVGGRRIKLLDWGVARIAGEPDPLFGMVAGTLTYVAPEQLRGESVGPAGDVYSLAVLAYRVLCACAPFTADEDLALMQQHLHDEPPTPAQLGACLPDELADLLVRALAKTPATRPTVADLMRGFQAAAALEAVSLPEPESRVRAQTAPTTALPRPARATSAVAARPSMLRPSVARFAGALLGLAITAASVISIIGA